MPFADSYRSSELVPSKDGQQNQGGWHFVFTVRTDEILIALLGMHVQRWEVLLPLSRHTTLWVCISILWMYVLVLPSLALISWRDGVPCCFSFCRHAESVSERPDPPQEERGMSLRFMLNKSDTSIANLISLITCDAGDPQWCGTLSKFPR